MVIQTKVIKVENLLKGSNAVKEKMREDARQAAKDEEDKKQEKSLEKVKPKKEGKGKFKMPKVPGTGIFGAIWKFISTIILGRLFMILFDHLPKLLPILKVAAVFVDTTSEVSPIVIAFDVLALNLFTFISLIFYPMALLANLNYLNLQLKLNYRLLYN